MYKKFNKIVYRERAVQNYQRLIVKMIGEISLEQNYKFSLFSESFIIEIKKGDNCTRVFGYQFDNLSSSTLIATDKTATSEILSKNQIPAVDHFLFLSPEKISYVSGNLDVETLIKKHGTLVIKPLKGTSGEHIYKFSSLAEFQEVYAKVFPYSRDVALSPFVNLQREYRCIVLDGKVKLLYEKIISSGWKHNLALGAVAEILDHTLFPEITTLALSSAKCLNLDFCAVDIGKVEDSLKIVEVNSGIMFERFARQSAENYEISKKIYSDALQFFLSKKETT